MEIDIVKIEESNSKREKKPPTKRGKTSKNAQPGIQNQMERDGGPWVYHEGKDSIGSRYHVIT